MREYEVTLVNGVKTTLQLADEDVKNYPGAKRVRSAEAGREVAADATAAKRSRGGSKETR